MKKAFFLYFLAFMFLPAASFGQRIEFTKPYKYTASNDDSRNSAKTKAMEEAQAALLREIGVLVEARQKMTTKSSGNNTKEDFVEELKTYTIGKVQTTVVAGTERFTDNEKGDMVYSATFSMVVDTADLYKYLDNIVKQKEQERLADIQKQQKIERLRKEIEELKKQVEVAKGKENDVFGTLLTAQKRLAELKIQKDDAEQSYKNTINTPNATTPAGIAKTKNAADYLMQTTNQYNAQEVEYKKLEKAMQTAQGDVSKAQDNLYNAQVIFANETGAPKPEKSAQTVAVNTKSQAADGDIKIINGIECVLVKAGTFTMGSPTSEANRENYETQHKVTLTQDYYISKYPITNAQFGKSGNANHPVVNVTWFQASDWAKSIGGRLPTEAEWEFAARGGNKNRGSIYSGSNNLDNVGWYNSNSGGGTKSVGQKQPNELGIYDMSGNIFEWCGDWYSFYPTEAVTDPVVTRPNYKVDDHVFRGGSWGSYAQYCRVANRNGRDPSYYDPYLGFRVVFPAN